MKIVPRAVVPILLLLAACSRRSTRHEPTPSSGLEGLVLTAADIEHSPGQTLEQLLLARVPGMTIERAADGHMFVRLRGTTTLMGEQEALVVVNGIALDSRVAGNLSAIHPRDINTVQVLRDAAATAAYGVRGSNGVIVIRTKT
jgi:iron complex outermembrane receptor protein